jgi:hypothetical protein
VGDVLRFAKRQDEVLVSIDKQQLAASLFPREGGPADNICSVATHRIRRASPILGGEVPGLSSKVSGCDFHDRNATAWRPVPGG